MEPKQSNSAEQKPSIGRIVHYISYGAPNKPEHQAAVITAVRDEDPADEVALTVFTTHGQEVHQRVNKGDREGTWHWPERV